MDEVRQKALLLFQQGRHELAERDLHKLLAANPADAWAHGTLALCLIGRGKLDAADAASRAAVAAAPGLDYAHNVNAIVLASRGRLADARAAALEAIRLDPNYAGHRGYLAAIELDLGNPDAALREADTALAINPRHTTSLNVRAEALIAMGRAAEARQVLESSLEVNPDDDDTHRAMGFALSQLGDSEGAMQRYREALRLDPNSKSARAGLLQAMRTRRPIYRWLLKPGVSTGRETGMAAVGVVVAIIAGKRLLWTLFGGTPNLLPVAIVLAVLLASVLLLTFFAEPLFNLLIRFDPLARNALSAQQRADCNYLLACVLAIGVIVAAVVILPDGPVTPYVAMATLLALPLSLLIAHPAGRHRRRLAALTTALAALGAAAATAAMLSRGRQVDALVIAPAGVYALGCVLSVGLRRRESDDATGTGL